MTALKAKLIEPGSRITFEPPGRKEEPFSLLHYVRHCLENGDEGRAERRYVSSLGMLKNIEIARIGEYIPPRAIARDMNITTDPAGGYLVAENTRPDDFVAALGPVALANRLGVEVWPGLVGDAVVPKEDGSGLWYWLDTEGNAPDESPVSLGAAVLRTRTIGCLLPPVSRNLLLLGARRSTEPILKGMVRRALASGIDTALFAGSGVNGQPAGVLNTPGIDSRPGAGFSLSTGAGMIKVLEDGNVRTENAAWIASPDVAEILRKRPKISGGEVMMVGDDNLLMARPLYVTTSIPSGTILLGNFQEGVVLATWGPGIEILIDDKTRSKEGQVRIIGFASIDVFVRRTAAFAIATGVN